MPDLKLYTISDLRNWLVHNQLIEGLSEKIIAPARAWAILHNPYVKDNDAVVCAIFEEGNPVAYTATFPEWLEKEQRIIWWFTTLYCHPSAQGKGYGMIVIGQLCELIGEGNYFDMDGAAETVSIFNYLGLTTRYIPRYVFTYKQIQRSSFKGLCASLIENFAKLRCNRNRISLSNQIAKNNFTLRYITHIDDVSYNFIISHAEKDALLRSQDMLNWILSYPFMQQSPVLERVEKALEFSSDVRAYSIQAVQVWKNNALIGVFIYRILNDQFSLKYLYYDESAMLDVFESITEHFIKLKAKTLQTTNAAYAQWLKPYMVTTKYIEEKQSFSYPEWFDPTTMNIQQGDGDVFV